MTSRLRSTLISADDGTQHIPNEGLAFERATPWTPRNSRGVCIPVHGVMGAYARRSIDIYDSFVENEDTFNLQLKMAYDRVRYSRSLAFQLWDTYDHTLTHLLHMWRWIVSSNALLVNHSFALTCSLSVCVSRNIYCKPIVKVRKVALTKLDGCDSAATEPLKELNPSLVAFNKKLWQNSRRQLNSGKVETCWFQSLLASPAYLLEINGENPCGCSRLLQSLRSLLRSLYDEVVSKIFSDFVEFLQVQETSDVSFLSTENHTSRAQQRSRGELDNNQSLIFAVAGSDNT